MNEYPHSVIASVVLVDNKIMDWAVGHDSLASKYVIKASDKCRIEEKEFVVHSLNENNKVFRKDSKEWMKQWKIHEKFDGFEPF